MIRMFRRPRALVAAVGAVAVGIAGLGVGTAGAGADGIEITGSSTVEPITRLVAELWAEENPSAEVRVDGPGTGDGFELFCSAEPGQWDATDASRAIEDEEAANCAANNIEFTELLVGIDGLTVVANKSSKLKCLDHGQLYGIFGPESGGGDVKLADAQALATEVGSPAKKLPKGTVTKFTPGPESGTYDSFIELGYQSIMEERLEGGLIAADLLTQNDEGEDEVSEPLIAKGTFPNDNNIVQRVEGSKNGLGFFGFAYFQENKGDLKSIGIYNDELGRCVKPSAKTIQNGTYPISRPLFIYADNAKVRARGPVKSFFDYYITEESLTDTVTDAGYVPADADTIQATIDAYAGI